MNVFSTEKQCMELNDDFIEIPNDLNSVSMLSSLTPSSSNQGSRLLMKRKAQDMEVHLRKEGDGGGGEVEGFVERISSDLIPPFELNENMVAISKRGSPSSARPSPLISSTHSINFPL